LGLFLLAFAALLSPTRGDEPEWRPLEDFNAVWIPRWSAELYEEECQGGIIDYGVHTISQVYLAWDAQEGASAYDFKADCKEGCFPPMPQYILSGDAVPEDIPQPAMGIARLDMWVPGDPLAAGLTYAESLARGEICLLQNEYDCYLKSIYNYQIAMEFEYLAGEPPVITGTGTKGVNITLTPPYEFDPRDTAELTLKVKVIGADNQPLPDKAFVLRIRNYQRGASDTPDTADGMSLGGHWHSDSSGLGRPIVHFKDNDTPTLGEDDDIIKIREYYYRKAYIAKKNTYSTAEYKAVFNPKGSYGTLPVGGDLRFEVYYPAPETNDIAEIEEYINARQPAAVKYMNVRVPNLGVLGPSANGRYSLTGGTDYHPGPPRYNNANWNHSGTAAANQLLIDMADAFYSRFHNPNTGTCTVLQYNDMFLCRGGKFELGPEYHNYPFWSLDPHSSHREHYGYTAYGVNCDFNYGILTLDERDWVINYMDEHNQDFSSGLPFINPEGTHWHLRINPNTRELENL